MLSGVPGEVGDAIYVWRSPKHGGTPIDSAAAEELAQFAVEQGIERIFYDDFGNGSTDQAAGRQSSRTLQSVLSVFTANGLDVEALYTDAWRIQSVVNYNRSAPTDARFCGIRINFENEFEGNSPEQRAEPTTAADIAFYADAVEQARRLPVFASISFHWDHPIEYAGITKPAYQHIIDTVAGVDIQTAQDSAAVLRKLTCEEVAYANAAGKPCHVTIETSDVIHSAGLNEWNTFYDEGENVMQTTLSEFSSEQGNVAVAYHFYKGSFGITDIASSGWSRYDSTDAEIKHVLLTVTAYVILSSVGSRILSNRRDSDRRIQQLAMQRMPC